ncbi:hypothetical protein BJ912DRAFT_1060967 [Pholiota molesta]|nr:hypothetical protein BJ912DRAFT_1060967 [Pholiota molesta]
MAVNTPKPDDAAANSCTGWRIIPNTASLAAFCSAGDGSQHSTSIAFSECVGNQDGHIGCQINGGAGGSCILSNLQAGQNFLTVNALCKNRAGQEVQTTNFNLNACLTNFQGNLGC